MKAIILDQADKSDPLHRLLVLGVKDGEKFYRYDRELPFDAAAPYGSDIEAANAFRKRQNILGEMIAEAIDDLIYHDGEKGRARARPGAP